MTENVNQIRKATILRIKAGDNSKHERPMVNVKVPIGMVKWGMKIGAASSPQLTGANLDRGEIKALVEQGDLGSIEGLDPDVDAIVSAKKAARDGHIRNTRFAVGAAQRLPYPDGAFDVVILSWTL